MMMKNKVLALFLIAGMCTVTVSTRIAEAQAEAQAAAPSTCNQCENGEQCSKCMATDSVVLCGKCGHDKASKACCNDDCEKCDKCGLHADSPLCCNVPQGYAGKDMCTKCGFEAGTKECCQGDCKTCGMQHRSPMCCRLTSEGCKNGAHCAKCMAANEVVLCGKCGHDNGSKECCNDGCVKCEKCGLHAGSPLCCKVDASMAGKDMCTKCGHEAGSEACCSDGCDTCSTCGMHKGSQLCCQLIEKEDQGN